MQGYARKADSFSESDLLAASAELQRIVVNDTMRLADPIAYRNAIAEQLRYLSTIVGELNQTAP